VDPSGVPLYIGYKSDDNVYFHGTIDEVRISDVVRTKEEIVAMMEQAFAVRQIDQLPILWGTLKSNHGK
jgi:hypothetical protein